MIFLEPTAGLCNRLRAIRCGINLARKYEQKLVILWSVNADCRCRWEDLFEHTDEFYVINFKRARPKKIARKFLDRSCVISYEDGHTDDLFDSDLDKYISFNSVFKSRKHLFIKTYYDFYKGSANYCWLHIKQELVERIDKILGVPHPDGIGIHIRRSDNVNSCENSTDELFMAAIERELTRNPDIVFYVASDDAEVKNRLSERYGKCILENSSCKLSRTTKSGMQDAVVDLFCLASMKKIYGSYWSSFSDEAAKIGLSELIILKKNIEQAERGNY